MAERTENFDPSPYPASTPGAAGAAGAGGNFGSDPASLGNMGSSGAGRMGSGAADTGAAGENAGDSPHRGVAGQAKEQVKNLASEAKHQTVKAAGQARDHVKGLVSQQKDQAAGHLGSLAGALREAGQKLDEGDDGGGFGRYTGQAADQVERLSHYLRDSDLSGFVRDAETFARRRPEVFLGGAFLAGLALARFLKASTPEGETFGGGDGQARSARPSYGGTGRPAFRPEEPDLDVTPDSNPSRTVDSGMATYNAPMGYQPWP